MGPDTINDLPAHILLVHLVVVLIPATAILAVAGAVSPRVRDRLGIGLPLLGLLCLVLIPLTTDAGEYLKDHVPPSAAIETHEKRAEQLLWWAIGLFIVTILVWLSGLPAVQRSALGTGPGTATRRSRVPLVATVVVAVLALGVGTGAVIQTYRAGDSGSKAVWDGVADD